MDVLFGSMQRIGHRATWLIAGLAVALVPALWMWGFTVDDALISVRYARHLVSGLGWRFDAGGPPTDGVTPLPWPVVLAPLAHASAEAVLLRAKVLGLLVWAITGAALGDATGREAGSPVWARAGALGLLALSVPVAAHAVSGMETALATSLATFAVLRGRRPLVASVLAGLAASLRPELAPWAFTLATGVAFVQGKRAGALGLGLVALLPFAVCAVVRSGVWGHAAPLAVQAKPSDLTHGLAYAGAAIVVVVTPVLALAPAALRRAPLALAVVVAASAHVAAVILVGGDWMPYARLLVPVAPSLVWAAVLLSPHARPIATGLRLALALTLGVSLLVLVGTQGRHVGADRAALVAEAAPQLVGLRRIASLDVGWVSAATEADVLDLAGVTDPQVAALPGGHTSKRIDATFLLDMHPDALLLLLPQGLPDGELDAWSRATYPRVVEHRLATDPVVQRHFAPAAWLPLGAKGSGYVLLKSRAVD
jgi:hypothetical protein